MPTLLAVKTFDADQSKHRAEQNGQEPNQKSEQQDRKVQTSTTADQKTNPTKSDNCFVAAKNVATNWQLKNEQPHDRESELVYCPHVRHEAVFFVTSLTTRGLFSKRKHDLTLRQCDGTRTKPERNNDRKATHIARPIGVACQIPLRNVTFTKGLENTSTKLGRRMMLTFHAALGKIEEHT